MKHDITNDRDQARFALTYKPPETMHGGTFAEVRKHIRANPWQPGTYGKGLVLRNKVWAWTTSNERYMMGYSPEDKWPAHTDALYALGAIRPTSEWRDEMSTFIVYPDGRVELQSDEPEHEDLVHAFIREAATI